MVVLRAGRSWSTVWATMPLRARAMLSDRLEEVLAGVGIFDERGAAFGQLGTEVRSIVAAEPEIACGYGGIRTADHFELEVVGDDAGAVARRMLEEGAVAVAVSLPSQRVRRRWCGEVEGQRPRLARARELRWCRRRRRRLRCRWCRLLPGGLFRGDRR